MLRHHSRVVLILETHKVHLAAMQNNHGGDFTHYYHPITHRCCKQRFMLPSINVLPARRQPCHSACTQHTTHLQMSLLLQQLGSRCMQRSSLHHPATLTAVPAPHRAQEQEAQPTTQLTITHCSKNYPAHPVSHASTSPLLHHAATTADTPPHPRPASQCNACCTCYTSRSHRAAHLQPQLPEEVPA
jgi:hypothetical protein